MWYVEGEEWIAVHVVQYVESESSYLEADVLHAEAAALYVKAAALFVVVEALYMEAVALSEYAEALLVGEQQAHHLPVDRENAQCNHLLLKKCGGT